MQVKYFGDITDFYKYYFLKNIVGEYKLGINWYLTADDESNDGEKKAKNKPLLEKIDKELFKILSEMDFKKFQSKYFNKDTKYYNGIYKDFHMEYFNETSAFNELKNQDIIFFDPDNGIEMPSKKLSERNKYVPYRILTKYWNENKTLVIFQHKDRNIEALNKKINNLVECLKCKKDNILVVNSKKVFYICVINKLHENIKNNIKVFCKNNVSEYNII